MTWRILGPMPPTFVALLPTPDQQPSIAARERVSAQSAAARRALKLAAREAGCPEMVFHKSDDVPQPWQGWHWSVSHDDTWVLGALARAPLGVDLERITLRRAALRAAVLNEDERALLGEVDALGFTRLWTAKEAVLKAAGVGLTRLSHCRLSATPSPTLTQAGEPAGPALPMFLDGEAAPVLQFRWHDHLLALHIQGGEESLTWVLPSPQGVSCQEPQDHVT